VPETVHPYGGTDGICQELRVIIGIGASESFLGGVEEVLTVKEDFSVYVRACDHLPAAFRNMSMNFQKGFH
jgi:hypothetical protein